MTSTTDAKYIAKLAVKGVVDMQSGQSIQQAYELARERYAELGVDVDQALKVLAKVSISLHCWQGDDVGGFENAAGLTGGGIQATGNYPGKARNAGRAAGRSRQGPVPDPRQASAEPARHLCRYGGRRIERR